jgi:hypothetical protein
LKNSKEEQEEQLLAKLPYAVSATFNHYRWQDESQCQPGTRPHILDEIMAWARSGSSNSNSSSSSAAADGADDSSSPQRIFWLDGMAGTGKSTIARTIARRCSDEGRLGASFFFSCGGGELETARTFVTTIAVQLARAHRQLQTSICNALRAHPDIAMQMLIDQWRQLVLGPCAGLHAAGALPRPLIIVVDALDECKATAEIEFVLALLSEKTPCLGAATALAPIRIFLTSRPEVTVRAGLHDISDAQRRHIILHHVEPSIVNRDIGVVFVHSLRSLIRSCPFLPQLSDEEVQQRLVDRAGGLFIWAATACRFIKDGGPRMRNRLDSIVAQRASAAASSPERKLDEIYTSVLRNALRKELTADEVEQFCQSLKKVLGTIAVLFSSLSAPGLAALLSRSESEVLDVLCDLHSVLDVPQAPGAPIRPHHASVHDFLLSSQRCTDARFWVDERQAHDRIARQYLLLMTTTLKRDICGLEEPGVLLDDVDQERVEACVPSSLAMPASTGFGMSSKATTHPLSRTPSTASCGNISFIGSRCCA